MTTDHSPPDTTGGTLVPDTSQRGSKVLVVAFAALVAVVVAYFAFGMPGMDHGTGNDSSMAGMDMGSNGPHHVVSPGEFEMLFDDAETVMNVHIPFEGEITGTDLSMPYNALEVSKLPADKSAKLLVYCMTGNMSAEATATLIDLGYTDVVELDGGMEAWRASGRTLMNKG